MVDIEWREELAEEAFEKTEEGRGLWWVVEAELTESLLSLVALLLFPLTEKAAAAQR
jgi:hypothetical protein